MKLTYKDLFTVQDMIGHTWDLPLTPKLFMKLRRLAKTIGEELKTFDPERMKLFRRFPQFIKNDKFVAPQLGEDRYAEFMQDYDSVYSIAIDIPYENIDVAEVEKKIEESKDDIVGRSGNALLDLIEQLNKANNEQKIEPMPAKAK